MSIGGISGSVSGSVCSTEPEEVVIRPSSYRWRLLDSIYFKNICVLKIKYKGCTNFEGVKIMVMRDVEQIPLVLDPHFLEESSNLLARFRPTEEGWLDALNYAVRKDKEAT